MKPFLVVGTTRSYIELFRTSATGQNQMYRRDAPQILKKVISAAELKSLAFTPNGLPMIFPTLLRVLCLCFGSLLILLSVPIGLMATIPPLDESMTPLWEMMTIAIGLATVLASGFMYVGLFGERPQSVARHRLVAGVLLVMPIALGTQLLLAHGHPEMRPFGWFFLVPSVIAFVSFAWPGVARPALPFVEISE